MKRTAFCFTALFVFIFFVVLFKKEPVRALEPAALSLKASLYRDELSDDDQALYDAILFSLSHDGSWVDVTYTPEQLVAVGRMVLWDHPEYTGAWPKVRFHTRGDSIAVRLSPGRSVPKAWYARRAKTWNMDEEPARAAFSEFLVLASYTSEGVDAWSDVGVIYDGKACCQGYAVAYKRALDVLGIPNRILYGVSSYGIPHVQNAVCLDGVWRVCDLTMGERGWMIEDAYVVHQP